MARFQKSDASPADGPGVHTRSHFDIILDDADLVALRARQPVQVRVSLPPSTPIHDENVFTVRVDDKAAR